MGERRGGSGHWPASLAFSPLVGLALFGLGFATASLAQSTPPGSAIRNIAAVEFNLGSVPRRTESNEVLITVRPAPSPGRIELLRYAPGAADSATAGPTSCAAGGAFQPLGAPRVAGAGALDPLVPLPLGAAPTAHAGDAIFIRVTDADQNLDATRIETVDVRLTTRSGDVETVRLSETGPNTGVFVGYMPTRLASGTASGSCQLDVAREAIVEATYTDPLDPNDIATAATLVDPSGRVFDSATGAPVDGVRVRLIDQATGQPAAVFGDDGVSRYPAEVITGAAVTDSGGTIYQLAPGEFRFPLVAPGNYRFEVLPPPAYSSPSNVPPSALALLPGGPFRIADGSYGAPFAVLAPPGIALDIPVDPEGEALALQKLASVDAAAVGDLIEYRLELRNASERRAIRNIVLTDRLPLGLRLRAESLRLDGRPIAPVNRSADGTEFSITVAQLAAGAHATLRYVAEVTPAARGAQLVNVAFAVTPGGRRSNDALARIALRRDFFADKGFIVGRIVHGGCDALTGSAEGVADVRVYLEDGRYALSDSTGRYHFEDLTPGSHVLQVDTATLPAGRRLAPCADNARHAGRDYSQFVELRAGELRRVDFALIELPPPEGELHAELATSAAGDGQFWHTLTVRTTSVPAANVRLVVVQPAALRLLRDGTSLKEGAWTLNLGDVPPNTTRVERWRSGRVDGDAADVELRAVLLHGDPGQAAKRLDPLVNRWSIAALPRDTVRALQFVFTPRFAVLDTRLTAADERELEAMVAKARGATIRRVRITGHADRTPIGPRGRRRFRDNLELSRARADAVARWFAERLSLPDERIEIRALGDEAPEADGDDAESLARNRRVEVVLLLDAVQPQDLPPPPAAQMDAVWLASAQARLVGRWQQPMPTAATPTPVRELYADADIDIETLAPDFAFVAPRPQDAPAIPALKVAIQHPSATAVQLSVNGAPADPLTFDGVTQNRARTVQLSRWRAVPLRNGANELRATLLDATGTPVATQTRTIHFGGGPVRAQWAIEESRLVADGQQRPLVALRLIDAYGQAARPGSLVSYQVLPPYRAWAEVERLDDNPLLRVGSSELQAEVGSDGIARIELEPTTQSGHATLRLRFNERRDQELRVWIAPAERDFIMVGIASGTVLHRSLSANIERSPAALAAYADERIEEGTDANGRIAFFAKGRIRGDYLLTIAYDSARDPRAARERINGIIRPDQYYLLYGDNTESRAEAASTEKLYLKLERRQFAALFGDYDTGFTITELARYNRSLTGLKTEYAGARLGLQAFTARTDLGVVRDEIAADGTSGLYRLSRRPIVVGSDKLQLETRDRFNPERIIETRSLARFLDYRIDYEQGTIVFKQPVPSRDGNFNPILIVVEYETPGTGVEVTAAGARVALRS
ncbi:MAG: OmpA family protein, partial [Steroidobacteraceae bacterium]|nr:OmpA family protein [Steroidobacteraceae bacterium]